jgi:hypothetical protein
VPWAVSGQDGSATTMGVLESRLATGSVTVNGLCPAGRTVSGDTLKADTATSCSITCCCIYHQINRLNRITKSDKENTQRYL